MPQLANTEPATQEENRVFSHSLSEDRMPAKTWKTSPVVSGIKGISEYAHFIIFSYHLCGIAMNSDHNKNQ